MMWVDPYRSIAYGTIRRHEIDREPMHVSCLQTINSELGWVTVYGCLGVHVYMYTGNVRTPHRSPCMHSGGVMATTNMEDSRNLIDGSLVGISLPIWQHKKPSNLGLVYFQKILQNRNSGTFVYIWQILSNYRLTRLKRFVSSIPIKMCS